jgi:hypothetical protein
MPSQWAVAGVGVNRTPVKTRNVTVSRIDRRVFMS